MSHSCQLGRKKCEYIIPMLNKELIESYKATTYRVTDLKLDIRIGEKNKRLDFILENQIKKTWAFITAWNPESKLLSSEENKDRNDRLRSKLKVYQTFDSLGIPKNADWTPEESFFIIGINQENATQLGVMFKQNAILFGKKNEIARLIFCI